MIVAAAGRALMVLPVIVVLIALLVRSVVLIQQMVAQLSAPQHRKLVLRNFSCVKVVARVTCLVLALVCLWLALARIQYPTETTKQLNEQGRDLLIALDISRSMLAQDYPKSRLATAQKKIQQLMQRLDSERVGLIVFSGSALVQCPLTKDFASFELFLNALDAESMTHASTDIASALTSALNAFEQQPDRQHKLLVIFTDGEDFSADLSSVQQRAADVGMRVCTVGIASPEGAPIPLYTPEGTLTGHLKDEQGTVVMSRLDEATLSNLAQKLSGLYVRADAHRDTDIDTLCQWVKSFDKETFAAGDRRVYGETFIYFAAMALVFLILSRFL